MLVYHAWRRHCAPPFSLGRFAAPAPRRAAAKRAYRQLSMRVHPDRCILPSAEGAFAAASQAVEILREQAEALLRAPPAPLPAPAADGDQQAAGEGGAAGVGAVEEADPGAVVRFVDAEELLQQVGRRLSSCSPAHAPAAAEAHVLAVLPYAVHALGSPAPPPPGPAPCHCCASEACCLRPVQAVWNQNRLAVPAMLVSPEELRGRGLLHPGYQQQFAEGSSLAAEPLVFLPVASIPTLRKRRRLLTAPPALRAAVSGGGGDVAPTLRAAQPPAVPKTATSPVQASDCHGEATAGGLCAVERVPPEQHQTCEPQDALGEALQQAEPPVEQRCAAGEPHSPEPLASPLASGVSQPSELAASSSLPAGQPAAGGGPRDAQPRDGPGASRVPLPGGPPTLENGVDMDMDSDLVEGLLLVSARAALWGRFPLNGTYFQARVGAGVPGQYLGRDGAWGCSGGVAVERGGARRQCAAQRNANNVGRHRRALLGEGATPIGAAIPFPSTIHWTRHRWALALR